MSTLHTHSAINKDWCHICGVRRDNLTDIFYPENAENQTELEKYIRVCCECANGIAAVAKARPGVVIETEHPKRQKHKSAYEKRGMPFKEFMKEIKNKE